ncbi:MAG: hypothetical protein HZB59_09205 [Ignavibacteriales bacterium]|nr:hypothetical protein [Ignavibacteriales bacterium]
MKNLFLILSSTFIMIGMSFGQADSLNEPRRVHSTLSVNLDYSQLKIYVDSTFIGVTPIDSAIVASGTHKITAATFHSSQWNNVVYEETIDIPLNSHVNKYIFISKPIKIFTEPFNAAVYKNDLLVGRTPMTIGEWEKDMKIKLTLNGYRDSTISIVTNEFLPKIFLQQLTPPDGKSNPIFLDSDGTDKLLPVYIAGGTAIVSGVTAAYYKIQADKFYKEYRSSKNNQLLDRVKRFDTVSGISLAVSQVSIAILSYLLFSQ